MPLPKISTAEYDLKLPSNGKTIKYRPFLVREEKILILALESENQKQITSAVKQVLKECVITKGIKIDQLPSFDIEYLFLNIRGKSVARQKFLSQFSLMTLKSPVMMTITQTLNWQMVIL